MGHFHSLDTKTIKEINNSSAKIFRFVTILVFVSYTKCFASYKESESLNNVANKRMFLK